MRGFKVCKMHGAGSRKRIREGRRKPTGRPPITGARCDPKRTLHEGLNAAFERHLADPNLRDLDVQLAYSRAVFARMWERYEKDGTWDVVKTINEHGKIMEHPASWFIEYGEKIQSILQKALTTTFKDQVRAACTLLAGPLKAFHDAIDKYVPESERENCREFIADAIAGALVPRME